jgi:AraC-like DNA-binding protein
MNTFTQYMQSRFLPKGQFEEASARLEGYVSLYDNFSGFSPANQLFETSREFINQYTICIYVMKGQAELKVDNDHHVLMTRTLNYVASHSVVQALSASEDFHFFLYAISNEAMQDVYKDMDIAFRMPSKYKRFVTKALTMDELKYRLALYNEMKRDLGRTSDENKKHVAQAYLCVQYSNDIDLFEPDMPDNDKAISRQHTLFRRFVDLLGEHCNREREVQFYARELGITPKYLSALCIDYSGKNASAWIDDYVISRVKFLMEEHRYNVKEISEVMNFPTQSFFGRYFKRVTGMSPRAYMRNL